MSALLSLSFVDRLPNFFRYLCGKKVNPEQYFERDAFVCEGEVRRQSSITTRTLTDRYAAEDALERLPSSLSME